ncbi:Zn-dependent hydrolase [Teichococcus vastitatis]|uniref:Zn-dependent hydrolase n=1 Tax=Teichococcus vastitatis TaxID=2307076 RepID=A0ABS9W3F1_9PROT|nr:Zn-dependent hydrolase [Pseudoroseomonas vastitatis]MCI0753578.1 Zn-dependent hydrolase [Pseudoroseomonas vastitatis]
MSNLPVSGARLWDSLMQMARIGATPKGGNNRQTLTDGDGEARALLRDWAEAIGCSVTVDRVGNMAIRREGRDPSLPAVAMGSHLDTQPSGGRFDGVLGVLAGLEVLRALHESGTETEAPIVLVNWTNEEGARFSPPMMGSGVAMELFPETEVLAKTDPAGAVFGEELRRIGWQGKADPAALRSLGAYFELHIEQGPTLEAEGVPVGVVDRALAQLWLDVTVEGEESHGGSAMVPRRDALVGAALLVQVVEEAALAEGGRGTVGRLTVQPDSRNVVPSRVWFSIDFRHGEMEALARMEARIRDRAAEITAERGLKVELARFWECPLTPFSDELVAALERAAQGRNLPFKRMPTGIGHDAVYVARRLPTAMIFVPCEGGLSHNEAENITPEWAEAGLAVLADAVLATARPVRGD